MTVNQIPNDPEAEKAVLGSVFLDSRLFDTVSDILCEDDFYIDAHRLLYRAYRSCLLHARLDIVNLKAELEQSGSAKQAGGMEYVIELANFTPGLDEAGVKRYAELVKDCSTRRKLIRIHSEALNGLYDKSKNVSEITENVQAVLADTESSYKGLVNFGETFCRFADELGRRQKQGNRLPGISTGYASLDIMTGGLENGKLYVIGARPAMGKTALALNITANIAGSGKTVAFFSLEMQEYEVIKRVVSSMTSVNSYKLKTANISDRDYQEIAGVIQRIGPDDLLVDDQSVQTAQSILSACIRENNRLRQRGRRINAVVIDYLQLMGSSNRRLDRRAVIEENSRMGKIMAKTLDCPVLLLSQLSRANESRQDKKPLLSDLRESGSIEQDADVVAFIHREEYYEPKPDNEGWADIIIAKNRDGKTGAVPMGWDGKTTTFFEAG